ncbi:hypothetical protein LV478_11635 [Komagataeibacter oboediens]|uniref:hypothetical protein n=1 Tax=Komagataeibacter oboediens TaxID=65958 RepID=UPI0023DB1E6D|nr:hypothetical protein [Komagataeibacter oboediens]WEQ51181.1 hypothetical protein LV478_11635 [Komagataeibacter oboediens]
MMKNNLAELQEKFKAYSAKNFPNATDQDSLHSTGNGPYDPDMDARVAKLEAIAENTKDSLKDLRTDLRDLRSEIKDLRKDGLSAVKWLLGLGATATVAVGGIALRILMTMPNH